MTAPAPADSSAAVWTLLREPAPRSGAHNMAVDTALLRAAREGRAALRLYQWSPSCLSFGRHEPATTRYDRTAIAALGLDTVRRPTGGRAVWHDAELTYAVAGTTQRFGSLQVAYRAIHAVLADAMRRLGIAAELAVRDRRPPGPGAGACFAAPVGGEVVAGGRKLVGSAQVREGGAFLQHGSILLEDTQDVVARITRGTASLPAATSVSAELGRPVSADEVAEAVTAAARAAWPGTWEQVEPLTPTPDDVAHYADDTWTWLR